MPSIKQIGINRTSVPPSSVQHGEGFVVNRGVSDAELGREEEEG